jgi:hypothetical protein
MKVGDRRFARRPVQTWWRLPPPFQQSSLFDQENLARFDVLQAPHPLGPPVDADHPPVRNEEPLEFGWADHPFGNV